jgi:hypothetical protein
MALDGKDQIPLWNFNEVSTNYKEPIVMVFIVQAETTCHCLSDRFVQEI